MRRNWWDGMDLWGWTSPKRCLAGRVGDLPFVQHVARERARVRGVRQRLTVEHPPHQRRPVFYVADAPQVEEPCS